MSYDPNIHHRHSIRLKGYDYSQEGLYYITICVQDRVCMFGNVGAPLVGAQHNYNAQHNNDTPQNMNVQNDDGRMYDDGENGRPRGHAPTGAQYNNDIQYNNDSPQNINVQNDDGRMYDDGENGRPRGHAPTCAQYNNDAQNDVNAPNTGAKNDNGRMDDNGRPRGHAPTCAQNDNDSPKNMNVQNDNGADNILGRMDDNGQNGLLDDNGRLQGHAPTGAQYNNDIQYNNDSPQNINVQNDDGRMDDDGGNGLLDINGRMYDDGENGRMDDNGRPRGHAPTHDATRDTMDIPTGVPTNAPIMILNDAGKMIETEWLKLTERFRNIELHEYVVMPNHFHGILQIVDLDNGRPQGHAPTNKTIGEIIGAFKSITTVEYIRGVKQLRWKPFDGKLWQRNYWEHIIRDDQSYQTISDYIIDNPAKWKADKFFNQ